MEVTVDKSAGFCLGVVRAIELAENELEKGKKVFSLGDIIHNAVEVNRLNKLGLETTTVDKIDELPESSKVLIRAHGEPPLTYRKAYEMGLEVIDATCPIVTRVQERVRDYMDRDFQVVIFGKQNHAEVIGIRGVTNDQALVVASVEEALEKVDFERSTVLFSQTTMDKATFKEIADALSDKIEMLIVDTMEQTAVEFHAKDTICGQVSGREKRLRKFAAANDVVVFTAGRKSSNGKVLYNISKQENPKTHFAESTGELDWSWFDGAKKIGITGATSTPHWVMEEFKKVIEDHFNNNINHNN